VSVSPLPEIAIRFLRLGTVAFGGPAAHIALMDDEFVERRRWLSRQRFLDLVGATNLIPGPNSTEMTMHVGYERGGLAGMAAAGVCFILPAAIVTAIFAWAYVEYGELPFVAPFLVGVKPAVLAVIFNALWKLGGKAVKSWNVVPIAIGVFVAVLAGAGEIPALLIGGVAGMALLRVRALWALLPALLAWPSETLAAATQAASRAAEHSLWKLGLFFLKVGSVLYGSGYVLIAFLEGGLVSELGWLTKQQLLDAVAVGQFTPGPVLTTATFVGYLLGGWTGAAVATLAIFLPSFAFVAILHPLVARLRKSEWASAFLDSVNAASVALMAAVTIELTRTTLVNWQAAAIAFAAALVVFFWKLNPAWLILGGAVAGRLFAFSG
jgi:chromate transporter